MGFGTWLGRRLGLRTLSGSSFGGMSFSGGGFSGGGSGSGSGGSFPAVVNAPVNEQNSMGVAAVACAVGVIAEAIACLPLHVFRHVPAGKELALDHPLQLVIDDPNPFMLRETWLELMLHHVLLWGNAYCEIVRDGTGQVRELIPIFPNRVVIKRNAAGDVFYQVYMWPSMETLDLPAEDVFHLKTSNSFDGIYGLGPIQQAHQTIELARNQETFGSKFFENAATPALAFSYPFKFKPETREVMRKSIAQLHEGAKNAGRSILLEEGMTVNPMTMPLESAQFLASRQFQVVEIARLFRINPIFLMDMGAATWGNLETVNLMFLQHTLNPWLTKIEAECRRKLLRPADRGNLFVRFDTDQYHRADIGTMQTVSASRLQNGQISINEWRADNGFNNIGPDGDVYRVQLNMGQAQPGGTDPQQPDETAQPDTPDETPEDTNEQ